MTERKEESRAESDEGVDRDLLLCLVETVIPARRVGAAMPAASELAEFCEISFAEAQLVYGPILELVRGHGFAEGSRGFASLDLEAREAILRQLQVDHPDVVRGAVLQTLIRYYGSDAVVRGLGLEARPAHPQGYSLDETNWALLEPVREMDPIYKAAPWQGDES